MQLPVIRSDDEPIDSVPIEVHNQLLAANQALQEELTRCRQKVAHLLKEKENK